MPNFLSRTIEGLAYTLRDVTESFLIAIRAISTHKMRSILTTLGIIIGIIAVTIMATLINGLEGKIDEELSELGSDVLYIQKWPWGGGPDFKWWEYINRPSITEDIAEVVNEQSRYALAAVPVVDTRRGVRSREQDASRVEVSGTTADYPRVFPLDLSEGRFFSESEARSAARTAIIGGRLAESLYPNQRAIGKRIWVGNNPFSIIGIETVKGSSADGQSGDSRILVPFATFKSLFGISRWRSVTVNVKIPPDEREAAIDELTGIIRVARNVPAREKNDFEINEERTIRDNIAPVKTAIYGIGIFLTSLALIVGGIGVMNIMFVSVKERTKEIGLRKAVGARQRNILTQFLIEAVIVCLLGGLVGVLISGVLTFVISQFLPSALPIGTVVLAFSVCVMIGILAGFAPALTAARSEPIDALRYE